MAKESGEETSKRFQEEIRESASRIWMAGLGALKVTEEEGSKLFHSLADEGERFVQRSRGGAERAREAAREAGERAKSDAEEGWSRIGDRIEEAVADALGGLGVPTRAEVQVLADRVEELTAAVDSLQKERSGASESADGE